MAAKDEDIDGAPWFERRTRRLTLRVWRAF
jgi:hypothetical protein